jgi:hypothetical protein
LLLPVVRLPDRIIAFRRRGTFSWIATAVLVMSGRGDLVPGSNRTYTAE